jgi:hypothetical protein
VRPDEFPAWTNWEQVDAIFKKFPNHNPWQSYRPIAPDGTFVFESVPSGELDLIVHGDGFISKNGGVFVRDFGVPQGFSLRTPLTQIEVKTEPTATLELTATTKDGKPVTGAEVYLNPNVIRIRGGLFGDTPKSSEIPFNPPAPLEKVPYSAKTDEHGVAVIRNVPSFSGGMEMEHPQFQVPLQDLKGWRNRYVHVSFTAGETNRMTMVLEPKGASYIGSPK